MKTDEVRFLGLSEAEIRAEEAEGSAKLFGHAAVFNSLSYDLGGFREIIAPGAFAESLRAAHYIFACWNHDTNKVLGSTKGGTLRLKEDDRGLAYEIDVPLETSFGRDAIVSVRRGDVQGASFRFRNAVDDWAVADDGLPVRTIKKMELVEISPGVPDPAYPQATAAARSMEQFIEGYRRGLIDPVRMRMMLRLAEATC